MRPATVIYEDKPVQVEPAADEVAGLWLTTGALTQASGWELKPEGICRGEICVPVPRDRAADFVRTSGQHTLVNLASLAEYLGMPVLHAGAVEPEMWFIGEAAETRRESLTSLVAPDFTLPDLDGKMHSLAEQRGKKVILNAWASW